MSFECPAAACASALERLSALRPFFLRSTLTRQRIAVATFSLVRAFEDGRRNVFEHFFAWAARAAGSLRAAPYTLRVDWPAATLMTSVVSVTVNSPPQVPDRMMIVITWRP